MASFDEEFLYFQPFGIDVPLFLQSAEFEGPFLNNGMYSTHIDSDQTHNSFLPYQGIKSLKHIHCYQD